MDHTTRGSGRAEALAVARLDAPDPLDERLRARLAGELVLLFLVVPLSLAGLRAAGVAVPVLPVLMLFAVTTLVVLARDPSFDLRGRLGRAWPVVETRRTLLLFAVGASLLLGYVALFEPGRLFALPRQAPWLWTSVLLLYPVLSVLPQELLFRTFVFHRYRAVLPTTAQRIAVSAAVFGLAHLVYGNAPSVLLSALGGVIFGATYARSGSLWLVGIEHALYGWWLFTVGLDHYFW